MSKFLKEAKKDICPAKKGERAGFVIPDDLPHLSCFEGDIVHDELCAGCEHRGIIYVNKKGYMTVRCYYEPPSTQVTDCKLTTPTGTAASNSTRDSNTKEDK